MEFYKWCHRCLAKQLIWFSACCHCLLSKSGFSCVVTARLINSGWISICCQCCFINQWIWFTTCLECCFSRSRGCDLPCVVTAYLWSSGCIPICCYWSLPKSSGFCFQYAVTTHLISIGGISINIANVVSLNSGCSFPDVFTSLF